MNAPDQMPEMVERVARAVMEADDRASAEAEGAANGYPPAISDWAVFVARAAIAAMREPTEAMRLAGEQVGDYPWDGSKPNRIFTAMIDAAIYSEGERNSSEMNPRSTGV